MPDSLIISSDAEISPSPVTERIVVPRCPSGNAWAAMETAGAALNSFSGPEDASHAALVRTYHAALEAFIAFPDGTTLGAALKLRLLNETEDLDAHLEDEGCENLIWPRIVKRLVADLGAAATPTDPAEQLWQMGRRAHEGIDAHDERHDIRASETTNRERERQCDALRAVERALATHPTTTHLGILRKLELFAELEGQQVPSALDGDAQTTSDHIISSLIGDLRALLVARFTQIAG